MTSIENQESKITDKASLWIFFVSFLSLFPMLFNTGIFWDDWTFYGNSEEEIMQLFTDVGAPYIGHLHYGLLSLPGSITIYKIITVLLHFLTGLLTWKTLKRLGLNSSLFFVLVLFSVALPFYSAKNTIICFPCTLCYFFFIAGCYSMSSWAIQRKPFYRLSSLALLTLSFTVPSTVFYSMIPVAFLVFHELGINPIKKSYSFKELLSSIRLKKLLSLTDFILLPTVYYILKNAFTKLDGIYAQQNYNSIVFDPIYMTVRTLKTLPRTLVELFTYGAKYILSNATTLLGAALFLAVITYCVFRIKSWKSTESKQLSIWTIIIGALMFLIGTFPYVAVRKVPYFFDFDTRFQLLLPLGTAAILAGGIFLIKNTNIQKIAVSVCLTVFVFSSFVSHGRFLRNEIKQDAIIRWFHNNKALEDNHTFIVKDLTPQYNAVIAGTPRMYEYAGMSKRAGNLDNKLIVDASQFERVRDNLEGLRPAFEGFSMKNYQADSVIPSHVIFINKGPETLSFGNVIHQIWNKHTDRPAYTKALEKFIIVRFEAIEQD